MIELVIIQVVAVSLMIFKRKFYNDLEDWKASDYRKPLVIRGARQVGKTTVVKKFGESFDSFIHLNLDIEADRRLFENSRNLSLHEILQRICLEKNKNISGKTLLFIDEIQNSPKAVELIRYFYELMPWLYVISAGSLLEIMMDTHKISFPVGRVEYRFMYPLSFGEYLSASGEEKALSIFNEIPAPDWAVDKLMSLFHRYVLIGGMPEIVSRYIDCRDVSLLRSVYQGLITAYTYDVSKYARSPSAITIIRHAIENASYEAGRRITFQNFGNSPYRSREIGDALRTLERAMLIYLHYPTTCTIPPLFPDLKKKPKLQVLDTGL